MRSDAAKHSHQAPLGREISSVVIQLAKDCVQGMQALFPACCRSRTKYLLDAGNPYMASLGRVKNLLVPELRAALTFNMFLEAFV